LLASTEPSAVKRILCATDFSDSASAAIQFAVGLAHSCQSEIRIVHVRPPPVPSGRPMGCRAHPPGVDEKSETELTQDLDRYGQPAIAAGLPTQRALRHGEPSEEIVREAKHISADLIVMGRHSQGASNPWILGSVAERVLRQASCPVVVVRPFPRPGGAIPRHVLCALDLGETAAATLEHAVAMANAIEAALTVLHVVANGQAEAARPTLAAVVAKAPAAKGGVREQVATGVPYQEILAAAHEHGGYLIVVGSHGGGIVDRQFLGSTALHLLRQSECPVLVVPARVSPSRVQPDRAGVASVSERHDELTSGCRPCGVSAGRARPSGA
jgi:nucleotide-binding universal stress UspA family protein